jgi:hypothetical protein
MTSNYVRLCWPESKENLHLKGNERRSYHLRRSTSLKFPQTIELMMNYWSNPTKVQFWLQLCSETASAIHCCLKICSWKLALFVLKLLKPKMKHHLTSAFISSATAASSHGLLRPKVLVPSVGHRFHLSSGWMRMSKLSLNQSASNNKASSTTTILCAVSVANTWKDTSLQCSLMEKLKQFSVLHVENLITFPAWLHLNKTCYSFLVVTSALNVQIVHLLTDIHSKTGRHAMSLLRL